MVKKLEFEARSQYINTQTLPYKPWGALRWEQLSGFEKMKKKTKQKTTSSVMSLISAPPFISQGGEKAKSRFTTLEIGLAAIFL